jgi:hypothetical protein
MTRKRAGRRENHDIGAAIIDLRFDAADNEPDGAAGERIVMRIVFSFSSDERSISDDADADADDANFAWRSSSVPDMDVGRRGGALAVVVAGGDFVAERPKAEEMDGTRVCDMGEVVVEREARWRAAGGGPIEPSTVRVGLTVVGVGSLFVVLVGDVTVEFIRTLLPSVVTRVVVVEGASEALPAFGASLLSSERRDAGRDEWPGGEKVVDSRRIWPTLLGAGVGPAVPLTLMRRFNYVFRQSPTQTERQLRTDQFDFLLLRIQRDVEALQVLTVPVALLLHLRDLHFAIRALRLQIAHLFP